MRKDINRKDFLKIITGGVVGALGVKWGIDKLSNGRGNDLGTMDVENKTIATSNKLLEPKIQELIDLEEIKEPNERVFQEWVFTEGWERQLEEFKLKIFDIPIEKNGSKLEKYSNILIEEYALRIENIPKESKHVPPLKFQDITESREFQNLSMAWDPEIRLERVIALLGARTKGQLQIVEEINSLPKSDRRSLLWNKFLQVTEYYNKAEIFHSRLTNALINPELNINEGDEANIAIQITLLREILSDAEIKRKKIADELWARLGNPHWDANEKIWPHDEEDTSMMPNNICARHTASVIRHMEFLSGRPEDSPIDISEDGSAYMSYSYEGKLDIPVDDNNLADWFVNCSGIHGWSDLSDYSLEDLNKHLDTGHYAVIMQVSSLEPLSLTHMVIVRRSNFAPKDYMIVCDVSNKTHADPYMLLDVTKPVNDNFVGRLYDSNTQRFGDGVFIFSKRL